MICDHEEMLDNILVWANSHPRFDISTMEGIKDNYDRRGEWTDYDLGLTVGGKAFTAAEERAIENVYNKFKIREWFNNND